MCERDRKKQPGAGDVFFSYLDIRTVIIEKLKY